MSVCGVVARFQGLVEKKMRGKETIYISRCIGEEKLPSRCGGDSNARSGGKERPVPFTRQHEHVRDEEPSKMALSSRNNPTKAL